VTGECPQCKRWLRRCIKCHREACSGEGNVSRREEPFDNYDPGHCPLGIRFFDFGPILCRPCAIEEAIDQAADAAKKLVRFMLT
jgi:hypothetical protein